MGMPAQRKVFRIEESVLAGVHANVHDLPPVATPDNEAALRHHEVMTELLALRALLNVRAQAGRETTANVHDPVAQAHELKSELDLIHEAIRQTKQDIGGLETGAFLGPQMARVGRELDAVIAGTEQATQNILKSAEDIDQIAGNISSLLQGEYAQGLAQDMRDHVVKIFEACNFQDITGQRIGKVIATLKFIEDHINRMRDIWRGIGHTGPTAPDALGSVNPESKFLNGPRLAGDTGHSSQADIDMIFDSN